MKIRLYRGQDWVDIPAVDFSAAWREKGWSDLPPSPAPEPVAASPAETIADRTSQRTEELLQLYKDEGYKAIKTIAERFGIEKPPGGWDESIPAIVQAEANTPDL